MKKLVAEYELSNGIKPIVRKSVCPNCGSGEENHKRMGMHVYCVDCEYEWSWG